jgi:hypothetical protein
MNSTTYGCPQCGHRFYAISTAVYHCKWKPPKVLPSIPTTNMPDPEDTYAAMHGLQFSSSVK